MTALNPTATLRPTGLAYEASGELAIDTIRGMTMTIWRHGQVADVTVRNRAHKIGGGALRWHIGYEWLGRIAIHGVPWDMQAIRDARAMEWRVTLSVPSDA
jgi:hypothetical protein